MMGDFFYGWRRKVGCAALFMALVVTGAWVRSLSIFDVINCPLGNNCAVAMASWNEGLAIRIGWDNEDSWNEFVWNKSDDDYLAYTDATSTLYRFEQPIPDGAGCFATWYLLTDCAGIGFTPEDQRSVRRMGFAIFPYWSLVIPLTLLSACLILLPRKHRPKQPKPTAVNLQGLPK